MKVFIDASGDDGQQPGKATNFYTLGLIIFEDDGYEQFLNELNAEVQDVIETERGFKVKPEFKWNKLDDRTKKIVASKILTKHEIIPVVLFADKFDQTSGWIDIPLNETQFRTHMLRSLLWMVCSTTNINSNHNKIDLEFDENLVEQFQKLLVKEANKIKRKQISFTTGIDSKDSFGVQIADCLAGCYNDFAEGKNDIYLGIRDKVCEIEVSVEGKKIVQKMMINNLSTLIR